MRSAGQKRHSAFSSVPQLKKSLDSETVCEAKIILGLDALWAIAVVVMGEAMPSSSLRWTFWQSVVF